MWHAAQRAALKRGETGYGFSCSIAARISDTTSRQNRSATVNNRAAISRVHLTANGSGLNSLLPSPTARPSTADSSDPTVTAAFRHASWASEGISSTMIGLPGPVAAAGAQSVSSPVQGADGLIARYPIRVSKLWGRMEFQSTKQSAWRGTAFSAAASTVITNCVG